jgi:hypothetical protein
MLARVVVRHVRLPALPQQPPGRQSQPAECQRSVRPGVSLEYGNSEARDRQQHCRRPRTAPRLSDTAAATAPGVYREQTRSKQEPHTGITCARVRPKRRTRQAPKCALRAREKRARRRPSARLAGRSSADAVYRVVWPGSVLSGRRSGIGTGRPRLDSELISE